MLAPAKATLPRNVKVGSNCIICTGCKIEGDVTIGNGTIIHPLASIIAEGGPIVIGEHNLIEEKSVIINAHQPDSETTPVMVIGNNNVFETGSRNESLKIGDNNVFEIKSIVGRNVVVGNNCCVGAGCKVLVSQVLPDYSEFYGPNSSMRISQGVQTQILQMDFLYKVLPNYHYLMKKHRTG